ncbi:helix-turn-helix transcriptional regulator [Thauera butanivorans]|uniref:helix-turn-helix transcriptional regulator n=1 Tax=Thauera butanivorans TaxID=86174 RepID=UPI003AB800D9
MASHPFPTALAEFDTLPDSAHVDVKVVATLLGRSISSIWRDVRAGGLIAPVKVGPMSPRWNVGAIRRHLSDLNTQA